MPTLKRRLASLLGVAIVLTLVPATARPAAARDGSELVTIANRYRADAGVAPVRLQTVVDRIAVERGNQLAAARALGHDFDYLIRRLDEENVCWQQLGEIVAWNTVSTSDRLERFMQQWYNSEPHREIMLGSGYTHAGGSWKTGSDGRHYAVMVFVKICGAQSQPITYGGFTDIADSKYRNTIVWVHEHGIMDGCRETAFCPRGDLSRGALAQALADALSLPATDRDFFADDGASRFEDGINRLAAAGLARGCGDGNYCPSGNVRRGALATALATALRLPKAKTDYFRDDESSPHEANINKIAAAGFTTGCDDRRFCPTASVSRGHATVFLRRALD